MKKLILILTIFSFTGQDLIAQAADTAKKAMLIAIEDGSGNVQSGKIYASNARGASRNSNGGTGSIWVTLGDWSVDLTISEKTPAQAASDYTGPSHSGMGAGGWGSFTAGAYNRASGNGAFVGGFHNAAGPLNSETTSIDGSSIGQTAFGYGTQATGNASFSAGEGTDASGSHAVVFGKNTTASGSYSTALGYSTTASGGYSTALGKSTTASASQSTSIGESTTASGYASFASGRSTTASGYNSIAMGRASTASGYYSTVIGYNATVTDFASFVIGQYNSSGSSATSAGSFSTSAPAFVIGNGTSGSLSDAFKVMFNGDATVSNDLTVSGDVNISSDARLKSNIVSLGSTLSKLLLIDGKSYTMNKSGDEKIGILAQDVQEVFPELVSKDENEMLSVNYQGLVPVLINAIKEQEDKISRLEKLVEQLISEK